VKRNQRGKKRGNRYRPNRVKHWIKELGRRKVKQRKQAESEEKWKRAGFTKTKAGPPIYWCENNREGNAIKTRTQHEWQSIVADAKRSTEAVYMRFQVIPEFEGSENG
jgi:hypothetical protein